MDQVFKVQAILKACNIPNIAVYFLVPECQQWLTARICEAFLISRCFLYVARNQDVYKHVTCPETS